MNTEERTVMDEWAAKVKEANKDLARIQWKLVRCAPEDEQSLLTELRTQAQFCEDLKRNEADYHKERKQASIDAKSVEVAESAPETAADRADRARQTAGHGFDRMMENNRKQAIITRLKHLSADDLEALISVETAQVEVARAQLKLAEYERLAIEGKKDRLVHLALSNQDLTKVYETNRTKRVNDSLRSGGGIVRVESGDGK